MRRRLLVSLFAFAFAAACGSPNEPTQELGVIAGHAYVDNVTPNTQTILEGQNATWTGSITYSDTDHGAPTVLSWDYDNDGTPDATLCDNGVGGSECSSGGASAYCTRTGDTWDCPVDAMNVYTDSVGTGTGPTFTHTARVDLQSTTNPGTTFFDKSVTVQNIAPNSTIVTIECDAGDSLCTGAATDYYEGAQINFDGSAVDAGGDTIERWIWSFGDVSQLVCDLGGPNPPECGATHSDPVTHEYQDDGVFSVTFQACDEEPAGTYNCDQTPAAQNITVNDIDPIVGAITPDADPQSEGVQVNFSATLDVDATDALVSCIWDFGDGSPTYSDPACSGFSGTGSTTASHTYVDEGTGTYDVTLTVTDEDSSVNAAPDPYVLTINNANPVITSAPDVATTEGADTDLTIHFTDLGVADDDWTVEWDCDNDSTYDVTSAPVPNQDVDVMDTCPGSFFPDDGVYTVGIRVTDIDGGVATTTLDVTASNVDPAVTVSFISASTLQEGSTGEIQVDFIDPGADTHQCVIDWGDGGVDTIPLGSCTSGNTYTHTYDDGATGGTNYTVSVTVTDDDLGSGNDSVTFTINNVPPTVAFDAATPIDPEPEEEGGNNGPKTVTYDLSDPGNDADEIESLVIDWGDGNQETICDNDPGTGAIPDCVDGAGQTFASSHTYLDDTDDDALLCGAALCSVTLTATDKDTAVDTDSVAHDVDNVAPSSVAIVRSVGVGPVDEGTSVDFDITFTDPGSGPTETWTCDIDWGDGTSDTGVSCDPAGTTVSHAFVDDTNVPPAADWTITVTVTDDEGGSDTDNSTTQAVDDVDPLISNFNDVGPEDEGTPVTFVADIVTGAADGTSDDIVECVWDPGDGSGATTYAADSGPECDVTGGTATFTYTYMDQGVYTAQLDVTDEDSTTTDTADATINDVSPIIQNLSNSSPESEGTAVSFSADIDPGSGTEPLVSCDWDPGDGSGAQSFAVGSAECPASGTATFSYTYDTTGTATTNFSASLTVFDADDSTTDTTSVDIDDVVPSITNMASAGGDEGSMVSVSADIAPGADPEDTITSCDWDPGDGSGVQSFPVGDPECPANGTATFNYTYSDQGTYTAVLVVNDEDNSSTDNTSVDILDVDPSGTIMSNDGPRAESNSGADVVTLSATIATGAADGTSDPISQCTWDPDGPSGAAAPQTFAAGTPECDAGAGTATFSYLYTDDDSDGVDDDTLTATLVVDDEDSSSVPSSSAVTITNVAPTITVVNTNTPHPEGQFTSLTVAWSDPSTNAGDPNLADTFTITIDWDDTNVDVLSAGPNQTTTSTSHLYTNDGTYNVTVTVADDDGGSDSAPTTVDVTPVPLNISNAITNAPVNEGSPATVWIEVDDGGAGGTYEYSFDWSGGDDDLNGDFFDDPGDVPGPAGSPSLDPFASFTLDDNETRTVRVRVYDPAGPSEAQDQVTVTWDNAAPVAEAGAPQSAAEAVSVTFSDSFTDAGSADTHTCEWDFGDGSSPASQACTSGVTSVSHAYSQAGTYTATLTVTDDDGGVGTDTTTVTVTDVAPTITNVSNSGPVNEGSSVSVSVTASDPNGDAITTYEFDWDNDGNYDTSGSSSTATHTFMQNGSYPVGVRVVDSDGSSDTDSTTVTVLNVSPTVTLDPISGDEGEPTLITANVTDPGDETFTYTWTFGDGSPAQNTSVPTVSHVFNDDGTYLVSLVVGDGTGTGGDTENAVIADVPVSITSVTSTAPATEGDTVTVTAVATAGKTDGMSYTFTPAPDTQSGGVATYTRNDDTSLTVDVVANDGDGTDTDSIVLVWNNGDPVADAGGNQTADENQSVSFNAGITDPGSGDTHTCSWDFGDGNTDPTCSTSHTYSQNGNYTVTLTVTDDDGGSGQDTITVTVNDLPPAVSSLTAAPNPVDEGSTVTLDATASDPAGDPLTYSWDFDGDGQEDASGTSNTAQHAFTQDGAYTASVTVTDDEGNSDSDTVLITVNNVAPTVTLDPASGNEGETTTLTATATDPGDDTLTFTWDFGDGSPTEQTSAGTATHVYNDEGTYSATVTVDDGTDSGSDNGNVIISDVPVTISSISSTSPGSEGGAIHVTVVASAGQTDNLSYTFNPAPDSQSGAVATYIRDDDATISVTADVDDGDSGGAVTSSSVDLTWNNVDPAVTTDGPYAASEGGAITMTHTFTDAGAGDTHSCSWDFGDGASAIVPSCSSDGNVQHTYADNGNYAVTLTVTDDDGGSSTVTTSATVSNAAPAVTAAGNQTVDEGSALSMTVATFTDASASDTHSATVDWGDGASGPATVSGGNVDAEHTYGDNGSYTVTVTVTDDDGGSGSDTLLVTVNNVAPSLTLSGSTTAIETLLFTHQGDATDPAGDDDPFTWSLTNQPAGMTISSSGTIAWVPSYSQAGRADLGGVDYTVTVTVDDGDGGNDSAQFTVTAVWKDDDGDGMADTWEDAHGMDSTVDDSMGDLDGDGVPNIDEFHNDTGGPYTPDGTGPVSPLTGDEVNTTDVTLTTNNTTDNDGDPLEYLFEVYSDAALTNMIYTNQVPEGGGGTTSATVTAGGAGLTDNSTYWWRVRAFDDTGLGGPWSGVNSFFYNPVNDAPTAPFLASPLDAAHVPSQTPVLVVDNSTDADDTGLTYTFDVFSDSALTTLADTSGPVAEGQFGQTDYVVATSLSENTWYWWTVTATDPHGLATTSATGSFFVNLQNDEPTTPGLNSPAEGEEITTAQPILIVDNSTDPEGAPLSYLFELDTIPSFSGPDYESALIPEGGGGGATPWDLSADGITLDENETYYWRARAFDGYVSSEWVSSNFFVNVANDPPSVPVAQSPANGSLVNSDKVEFTFRNATDPDGDSLTYRVRVYTDGAGANLFEDSGDLSEGADDQTTWAPSNKYGPGKSYFWTIEAVDEHGETSGESILYAFETIDLTGGGKGCAVAQPTRSVPARGLLALLGMVLGALFVVRRKNA